jgi:hypothetical protein
VRLQIDNQSQWLNNPHQSLASAIAQPGSFFPDDLEDLAVSLNHCPPPNAHCPLLTAHCLFTIRYSRSNIRATISESHTEEIGGAIKV